MFCRDADMIRHPLPMALASLTTAPAQAATDVLPDLKARGLSDFRIEVTSSGEKRLRFKTRIANQGPGRFEVFSKRSNTSQATMTVSQRIFRTDGTYSSYSVPGTHSFYSGDGHNHWHVYKLQDFGIYKIGLGGTTGARAGSGAKTGFCFTDNTVYNLDLPNAPQSPHYRSCGTSSNLTVTSGLSVGWADTYSSSLPYQWIKINGLPNGTYRVIVKTDPLDWFKEVRNTNNDTFTDIKITDNTVVKI